MLFGKLGGTPPEFKCRPYCDVLCDIAVTHSPRYLINMELHEGETIFEKMNTTYDEFRNTEDNIAKVREYYKQKAINEKKQEMPWWITKGNAENSIGFNLRLWKTVEANERKRLTAYCLILFPETWKANANAQTKYNQASLWLCSFAQIVHPNIRDIFTGSGQVTTVNGERLPDNSHYPHIVKTIVDAIPTIKRLLQDPSSETIELIEEYNPTLLNGEDIYQTWVTHCCSNAKTDGAPLKEWIEEQPILGLL